MLVARSFDHDLTELENRAQLKACAMPTRSGV
jgi:hypothetical protein